MCWVFPGMIWRDLSHKTSRRVPRKVCNRRRFAQCLAGCWFGRVTFGLWKPNCSKMWKGLFLWLSFRKDWLIYQCGFLRKFYQWNRKIYLNGNSRHKFLFEWWYFLIMVTVKLRNNMRLVYLLYKLSKQYQHSYIYLIMASSEWFAGIRCFCIFWNVDFCN